MEIISEKDHILFVDDEIENLRGFKFVFKNFYSIHIAKSASEGFEILKQKPIKLIITDQRMPKMSGVDFLEKTALDYPNIIRIVITGYSDIEAIIKAVNKGKIYRYITKPWDKDELKVTIDNAIKAYNLKQENNNLIESLKEANKKLEEANQNLEKKVNERTSQILKQKEEIENHRNHLEKMVDERTTDLFKAKEKAEESDRLKSAFLANLSHEIRTPLHAIIGFSELLINPDYPSQAKDEFNEMINSNSSYLLRLIDDILDFSQIEAGQVTLNKSKFNVNKLLTEIYNQYNEKILKGANRIDFFLNINPHQDVTIENDLKKIKQIIINFLENAIKFTENGFIEIGYDIVSENKSSRSLRFYVKDTGIGLAEEDLMIIFERFRKVDRNINKLYRGTGLGLAICKRLTELLGGKIWVESEFGKGSVFYFTVPYQEIDNQLVQPSEFVKTENETFNWEDKLILVAEDETANFQLIEVAVSKTKVNLIWAKDGKETLELFESNSNIDLILMDIQMPELDGFEATKIIKKKNNKIPIIAQTAYARSDERNLILNAGCDDYISKPFKINELLSLINKHLINKGQNMAS